MPKASTPSASRESRPALSTSSGSARESLTTPRSSESTESTTKVFDQYLRTTQIPVLEYRIEGTTLSHRWANVVPGFDMPVKVTLSPGTFSFIQPIERWLTTPIRVKPEDFRVDQNFYITTRDVLKPAVPDQSR